MIYPSRLQILSPSCLQVADNHKFSTFTKGNFVFIVWWPPFYTPENVSRTGISVYLFIEKTEKQIKVVWSSTMPGSSFKKKGLRGKGKAWYGVCSNL